MLKYIYLLLILNISVVFCQYDVSNCGPLDSTFEIVTGWMYSSPTDILEAKSGTLSLPDCLNACKTNSSCQAINFETGLCVLFKTQSEDTPDALIKSQFPVFTMYAQKLCLPSARSCDKSWAFELVRGHSFKLQPKKEMEMPSRIACLDACIQEREFNCRSTVWDRVRGVCGMLEIDRYSESPKRFTRSVDYDYMESQCVPEPNRMCEFKKIPNRLLKTVDSLIEGVNTIDECRQLCLDSPYRCHTYDYEGVCRLSHHSTSTVTQIEEPYLLMNGSTSYQRESCYNVSLDCGSNGLIATIATNKIFSGKVYARSRPNSCSLDVKNSLEFKMSMDYSDIGCGIVEEEPGHYTSDIVLQHHDLIMTSGDLGFSLRCSFHLQNKSVAHGIELQVNGQIQSIGTQSSVVPSPNVTMRITDRQGGDIQSAQVGDPLSLRFEITDPYSPYEIFVRELIAMDGIDGGEIILIDSRGCPTDPSIMGIVNHVSASSKSLSAPFEAFKFPTSEIVQFQALITPCLPRCLPVNCTIMGDPSTGGQFLTESYGRRRRRSTEGSREQLLVVNQLKISDPFHRNSDKETEDENEDGSDRSIAYSSCLNINSILFLGLLFIVIQIGLVVGWFCFIKRNTSTKESTKQFKYPPTYGQQHQFSGIPRI